VILGKLFSLNCRFCVSKKLIEVHVDDPLNFNNFKSITAASKHSFNIDAGMLSFTSE